MRDAEILVGYDGSTDASVAVDWALEEARHSGQPVRLAYVFEWLTVAGWVGPGVAPGVWPDETARRQVEDLVRRAAADAVAAHPRLTVTGEVYDGPPALVLQERSAEAGMLVLGSRGHGGFGGLLVGSTAVSVAAHAHCPVVVVRDGAGSAPVDASAGPVAVGVDGSQPSLVALGFAAERAAQRQVPLRVLHAWTPGPGGAAGAPDERAAVEQALEPWRRTFPDLDVTVDLIPTGPAAMLIEVSRDARLVVVGSRGRGGLAGMLLGSVSQQLIQHANCPVAVVRER
ncbi:nucleotide-binding universal stress UspA family protein [Micromonospora luteifusca]|uniref:Nucleotide-binding universal stress UspA family protein n=1 Tax=Micromonospora luteifusca TaxID=709860 RepID=A0ABS2M094_9ACTN|nr:universal stress protein [Micromonospora luteifusca]MBM7493324.1 nucleotide-binding universal stress UspA family protein [Micromonospora luteifusca]